MVQVGDRMERLRSDLLRRAQSGQNVDSARLQQEASYSFAMGAGTHSNLSVPYQSTSSLTNSTANIPTPPPPRSQHGLLSSPGRSLTQLRRKSLLLSKRLSNPSPTSPRRGRKPPFSSNRGLPSHPRRQGRQHHAREAPAPRPVYEHVIPVQYVTLPTPSTAALQPSRLRDVELGDVDNMVGEGDRICNRRFLLCFPWPESRKVRTYILQSIVSFMFLVGLLGVYLGITFTGQGTNGTLNILLLVLVILSVLFFSYSFIRLCLALRRSSNSSINEKSSQGQSNGGISNVPSEGSFPRGFAVPHQPIQVMMAQDEQIAGGQTTRNMMPPAYGLFQESVRLDPDRLFWQERATNGEPDESLESHQLPRPPSYGSDGGISAIIASYR